MAKYNFGNIPQGVKDNAKFCLWVYSKDKTKIPIDPHTLSFGDSSNVEKFDTYENVVSKTNDKFGLELVYLII